MEGETMVQAFHPMRWFGESWGSVMNVINPKVGTPVGRSCYSCGAEIGAEDTGVLTGSPDNDAAWHWDCFVSETKKPKKP
jgi:hypothetical protein